MEEMESEKIVASAARLLRETRLERGISQRQLADTAGVNPAVVNRVERGRDARLSTYAKLFAGLGFAARLRLEDWGEEGAAFLSEEAGRRRERRLEGLCTGKRRFY